MLTARSTTNIDVELAVIRACIVALAGFALILFIAFIYPGLGL